MYKITKKELAKKIKLHELWLKDNSKGERLVLNDYDLSGSNLSRSDLSRSNLSDSDLSYSDLSYSDLSCSNLSDSNLSGSNLSGSNLSCSNLSYSNLSNSIFSILSFFKIEIKHISDELTLELMCQDAEFCGIEKMNKWAKGGGCPYAGMQRDFNFQEKCNLWKPGKPKLRGIKLFYRICKELQIKHSL